MPISRSDTRANQKARTRTALVEAARALLRAGTVPTVAEAAKRARVSRATAYRYFPTHDALLLEAGSITPATQPVEALVQKLSSADPAERLLAIIDRFIPIVLREETAMRAAMRTYLDTWLASRSRGERTTPVREGRRMRWIDAALAPVRRQLSAAQARRLRCALALVLSPEAVVVMKDVCRIDSDRQALEVLRWAACALVHVGLDEPVHARAPRRQEILRSGRQS